MSVLCILYTVIQLKYSMQKRYLFRMMVNENKLSHASRVHSDNERMFIHNFTH